MKWIAKALVQKVISGLPYKEAINGFFQQHVTGGVALTDTHFRWKMEAAERHLAYYRKHVQEDMSNVDVLELGSGWYPIVPIAMYLSGVRSITTIDIYSWGSQEKLHIALAKYKEWMADGRLKAHLTPMEDRWNAVCELHDRQVDLETFNSALNITPHLADARTFDYPMKYGFICSNNTLEHIHADVLVGIIERFHGQLETGGIMSHLIDLSDHFAHADKTITHYNFLKYSDRAWRRIDNDIQPQNRLRHSEYLKIYRDLDIDVVETRTWSGDVQDLRSVTLNQKYNGFEEADLLVSHADIISVSAG